MCHKIKKFSNGLMNHFPRYWVKIQKFDNYHPPYQLLEVISLVQLFSKTSLKRDDKRNLAAAVNGYFRMTYA